MRFYLGLFFSFSLTPQSTSFPPPLPSPFLPQAEMLFQGRSNNVVITLESEDVEGSAKLVPSSPRGNASPRAFQKGFNQVEKGGGREGGKDREGGSQKIIGDIIF